MTNTKRTKRALLSSVVALLLCFSMLVGTTFAWFTDSVTSAGNIIQSGTLDVSLEHADTILGVDDAGWTDASTGAIFNYSNWEPGYTAVKYVKIENEGTLDLKFILNVIPNNEAEEVNLADVIEVYMIDSAVAVDRDALTTDSAAYVGTLTSLMNENDGAAHGVLYAKANADAANGKNYNEIYTIALKMSTSAGNEYMGKSVGGGFSVQLLATQLASESDSFDDQYDMDAWSDVAEPPVADAEGAVEVWTAAQLAGVMGNMKGVKTINIMENIDLAGRTWNSANFWGTGTKTINGNGHTISNMTVNGDKKIGFIGENSGDITVNDLTFKNASVSTTGSFAGVVIGYAYGNIALNNVDVIDSEVNASIANVGIRAGGLLGFVPIDGGSLALKDCDVSGSTILGYHNVGAMVGTTMTQKTVTVENCTAKNNTLVHAGSNVGAFAFGAGDSGYTEYVPASGFTSENNTVICRVYTAGQLDTAIKSTAFDVITVASGEYGVVDVRAGRTLTIKPQDGATVKFAGINGQSNNNASDITIKGITIDNSLATEGWYTGTAQKIKPCVGVWGGNYTFEDCTFFVTGESGAETGVMSWWTTNHGTMTFKGCTFNGGNGSARGMQIYGDYDLNVEDCTFTTAKDYSIKYVGAEGCKATLTGNKVYNTENFVQAGSGAYPGKNYSIEFKNNILADGINSIYVDNDENQTIIIDGATYIAKAEKLAFSGADLHNSTTKSGNFKLSEDIKTSESTARYGWGYEYIIRNGADYTLDLNGKTIVHDTINENANNNALTYLFVANHAGTKLTINGEGKIYSNNSAGYACAVQGKDGTLVTVNGGDFEVDNGIAVWAGAGSHVVINGGSYVNGSATTDHELIYSSGGVIDIYGGFFHNTDGNYTLNVEDRNRATSAINVYGGTFVNFDPSTGGQDPSQIKVAEGYMVKEEAQENGDVWYTVVPIPEGTETVSSYESLTDASGTSGDHVLVGDVVATDKIYFGDNTTNTIDLNGKTVTAAGGYLFATQGENCVLTIEGNGEVNANSAYAGFANKGSTLNVNGGTFQLDNTNNKGHFYAQNSSTIVINDGTFVSTDSDTPIVYCINGFIEINGGFFQNTAKPDAALISMGNNLNYVNNQKVTLSGGTFVNWNPMDSAFAKPWTNPDVPALIVLADGYEMVSETQTNGDVWYMVVPIE